MLVAWQKRIGIKDDVVMTGGVALNKGMVRALERNLGFKIHTNEYCQLNGAIGQHYLLIKNI